MANMHTQVNKCESKNEQTENLCTTNHLYLQNTFQLLKDALLTGNGDRKRRALDPEQQEATSQCTSPASSNFPLRL